MSIDRQIEQQVQCPFCGHVNRRPRFGYYARPEPGQDYAEIMRCPQCRSFFAPIDKEAGAKYN